GVPGVGVERGDLTEVGANIDGAVDVQRRATEIVGPKARLVLEILVGRFPTPQNFEILKVVPVDLAQRRVFRRSVVAGIMRPATACYTALPERRRRKRGQSNNSRQTDGQQGKSLHDLVS